MQPKSFNFHSISEPQYFRFSEGRVGSTHENHFFLKTPLDTEASLEQFYNELQFRKHFSELKNILPLLGMTEIQGKTCSVFPLIKNDLVDFMGQLSTEAILQKVLLPLLETLEQMHNKNWIHADLKLENVRVDSANDFKIYLSDFGKSISLEHFQPNRIGALSQHLPPDSTLSPQFDIYSLGVLTFQLLFGFDFIKKFQMAGRQFSQIPESKQVDPVILEFIQKATEPSALKRFKNSTQAKKFLLGKSKSENEFSIENYNLERYFEFYLECMREIFIASNRSTRDFEKFAGPWGEKYYSRLKKWMDGSKAFVVHLKVGDDLTGICEATVSATVGKISSIFISPDRRGAGQAALLEQAAIQYFKVEHAEKAILNVETENQRAIAFYKKMGWLQGTQRQYETAFQFEKSLI